jgi:uncharacterized repeat protein (TIGR01451 family)
VLLRPPGLRVAGGTPRLGVATLEGDQGIGGDALLVNGRAQPEPTGIGDADNFFVSAAAGARDPAHRNNMGLDATTIDLPDLRLGTTAVDVVATAGPDQHLLHLLALSVPLPGIALTTDVDRPVAHAGEDITQRAVVTNTGSVPLRGVTVALALDPACGTVVDLAPGEHSEVTCTGAADTGELTASAAATDPAGGALTATATTAVRVIRSALAVRVETANDTMLAGEVVAHRVVATNTGDGPLTSVRLRGLGCSGQVVPALAAGAAVPTDCVAPASTTPVTATALDELGAGVTATGHASYRVVRADLSIAIDVPATPVAQGDAVTLTVRVRDTGDVAVTGVAVAGTPATCARRLPDLAPGAATVHTCRVVVAGPTTVVLVVSGTPDLPGRPTAATVAVHRTATVALRPGSPSPDNEYPSPAPDPPAPATPPVAVYDVAEDGPLRSPATPAIVAVLGVLVMTVSLGGLSAAARRGG